MLTQRLQMMLSSSSEKPPCLMLGRRQFSHLRRQLLPHLLRPESEMKTHKKKQGEVHEKVNLFTERVARSQKKQGYLVCIIIPIFCGKAIQLPPVPCCSMQDLSLASSSGDHGPFFTFALSQQGALPMVVLLLSESFD